MIKHFLGAYRLSYRLLHPIEWIMDLFREIRAFVQRGCQGYAEADTWDLNYHLCEWLPKALRLMAKYNHGCADEFFDEGKDDECWRWKEALIKMAEGFEAKSKLFEDYPELGKEEILELDKKWQEGAKLFIKHFDCLWD